MRLLLPALALLLATPALAADPARPGTRRAAVELEIARGLYPQDTLLALRAGDAWLAVGAWEKAERAYRAAYLLSDGGDAAQRGLDAVRDARKARWTLGGSTAGSAFAGDVDWVGGGALGAHTSATLAGRIVATASGRVGAVTGQSGASPWVEGHGGLGLAWHRVGIVAHVGGVRMLTASAELADAPSDSATTRTRGNDDPGGGTDDPGKGDSGTDDPGNDDPGPGNGNDDPGNDDPGKGNDDPGNDDPGPGNGNDDPGNDDPGNDNPGPGRGDPPDPDVPGGAPGVSEGWTVGLSARWSPWGDVYIEGSRTWWTDGIAHRGVVAWTSPAVGPFRLEPGASLSHDPGGYGWSGFTTLRVHSGPADLRLGGRIGDEHRPVSLGMGSIWAIPGRIEAGGWVGVSSRSDGWTVDLDGEWARMQRTQEGGPQDVFLLVLRASRASGGGR